MRGMGSRASAALLPPVTCTSLARRQPLLGITPGLCFFGHPPSPAASGWHLLCEQRASGGSSRAQARAAVGGE
jgi:hypothetical protein